MTLAATTDATPALLDEAEARAITTRIRQCVAVALIDIEKAFQGRAWEALGYSTWDEYCRAEFGDHIQLPRDERRAAVVELSQAGMSTRAIAAATGVSHMTVARELSGVTNVTPADDDDIAEAEIVERPTVTGLDGKRYQPVRPVPQTEVRLPETEADRLAREEREAEYYRAEAGRKFNEKVGDVLFILSEMASLPDTLVDFAASYGPPATPITDDDLRRVAMTIELLRDHWSAS